MLYDEQGRAYVEPPLLPQNQQVRYIVRDYHRMMIENEKLKEKNERLRESIFRINAYAYALKRTTYTQFHHISQLMKLMERKNVHVPADIKIYHEEQARMLEYFNSKNTNKNNSKPQQS